MFHAVPITGGPDGLTRWEKTIAQHVEATMAVGGFYYSKTLVGPFQGVENASNTTHSSIFGVALNYLMGRSDLPAALKP